ncbi:hypothetical protein NP493_1175g01020 [Ridgeia piscesae]|uniref:Uncharacterized protein n=1 Tax=Ridgeia piscesae TaxID=27915 RepID=A0AAD9KEN7_RIDPI|nr:hypothetical protein NP493_1175g01020 [Ridgeia piscesae]
MFTEAVSSISKTNELTFKTLPDLLGEFAAMSDTNRDIADQIQHQITGLKGAMVTSYNGLELFYELMPLLLPRKFTSFVEMKRYSGATLERLQEALRDDLWVFGYGNVSSSG